jgi:FAD/FMN-containing dehydrogenase
MLLLLCRKPTPDVFCFIRSQTCWLPAQCFIKPRSTLEVAVALKIVTLLDSKFAIRSAGHNPGPGFASIGPEGVLLDMRDINQVTLSSDKSYVSIGPGNTWEKVYNALEKSQLTVVGGRVAGVGVGGLILGGTYLL